MVDRDHHYSGKIKDFFDLDSLNLENTHITIGNFDGVHLGHQVVIKHLLQKARAAQAPAAVVTFFPNPSHYFRRQQAGFYLTPPDEKEALLLEMGVDHVVTLQFDRALSELTPQAFLLGLKEKLGLGVLVIGRDFALGKNRAGTLPVIEEIGERLSFQVSPIQPVKFGERGISSTEIRYRLDEGDVACVQKLLGRYYTIKGVVTHGADRGSRIGLPTANLDHWPQQKLPAIGVYATHVSLFDRYHQGITNVGYRPTFENQDQPNIETHILDFDGNIYGEHMALEFVQKIREEQKFSGVEAFLAQIERDKATARKIFQDD